VKHRLDLLIALFLSSVCFVAAQTIEVSAVEDEMLSGENTAALSEFIVSGCLDSLFESGYIGTNKRPIAGTRQSYDAMLPDLETMESFIDLQLLIFMEYDAGEVLLPPDVFFKLIKVDGGSVLGSGELKRIMPVSFGAVDIQNACAEMGRRLVSASLLWLKE